mmetsp:Transcript_10220/g.25244  ORF Transcript_10220/g.25244 Transcript_10220/m.25244 type:complete len:303 (+) Transcript_10220:254-1162(+)
MRKGLESFTRMKAMAKEPAEGSILDATAAGSMAMTESTSIALTTSYTSPSAVPMMVKCVSTATFPYACISWGSPCLGSAPLPPAATGSSAACPMTEPEPDASVLGQRAWFSSVEKTTCAAARPPTKSVLATAGPTSWPLLEADTRASGKHTSTWNVPTDCSNGCDTTCSAAMKSTTAPCAYTRYRSVPVTASPSSTRARPAPTSDRREGAALRAPKTVATSSPSDEPWLCILSIAPPFCGTRPVHCRSPTLRPAIGAIPKPDEAWKQATNRIAGSQRHRIAAIVCSVELLPSKRRSRPSEGR